MINSKNLSGFHVVRLNAEMFPISDYEASLHQEYGIDPVAAGAEKPEDIIPHVADCDAVFVISTSLPTEVIAAMERCQVISRMGIGTDKIDVSEATRRGIIVANTPGFCSEEMGDHTMALMLALARRIPQMSDVVAEGAWTRGRRLMNTVHRLSSQVLGLVGFGDSAHAVARRASGFGMRILATRKHLDAPSPVAEELGVEMVDLDTLLHESDYVSLHLPLNYQTYHFVDDGMLRKMKPEAFLLNTARGAVTDEDALAAALLDGRLAGAGIDTYEEDYPFKGVERPPDYPLLGLENVVLTPHVAALSVEAKQEVARVATQNVVAVLAGQWPPSENIVNPTVSPRKPLAEHEAGLGDP